MFNSPKIFVATVAKTVDAVRAALIPQEDEANPVSHALDEFVPTRNFRSTVIPAQAGIQASRPFSLGTRLRGYDGMSSSRHPCVVKHRACLDIVNSDCMAQRRNTF